MKNSKNNFEELIQLCDMNSIKFLEDQRLSEYTNTRTGGKVPLMVFPKEDDELRNVMKLIAEQHLKYYVLGEMTNIVASSKRMDIVIVNLIEFNDSVQFDENSRVLTVGAGCKMKSLSKWAAVHSITGLQWMEGIPGTVGAGAYMNAGFLAGEDFSSTLISARVLMPDLSYKQVTNEQLQYSYRKSSLQSTGGIVTSVQLLVRMGKPWKIKLRMWRYHTRRAKHQPLDLPSAGTVFVPPMPYHVGGILPQMGLTGYTIGGAQISKKSPGFIVGVDHMTGEDYYQLVQFIQQSVFEKYHVRLRPEVRLIGFKDDVDANKK
ncbi:MULTISPECIES: UDP-N-acetylmuramate dehydrogenase [Lactobacillaceae]|uniref:UDP-N-acetylmuramate dehydrogenase n=1 Tax=Lactobacillaceae TaxID=33958 RepID=UPI000BE9DC5B|nr:MULTISPECIES: UDP-N-acetylmuramate dehydrogenase [Lactobacillaceae]MBS1014257.1 UDP-N-acetylmuramate dehydrogenase [Levilactobacillus brevis]